MQLSTDDRELLLRLARYAIEQAVRGEQPPPIPAHSRELDLPCGAFVTLTINGELRGCIGYPEGVLPLVETVRDVAPKSAVEDPRFEPVVEDELAGLSIEISVLSPMEPVTDIGQIEVGTHGLVMHRGYNRGLLLPQVPTEYGWDRETFLRQTARKAGLTSDAWKDPQTKILRFTAEVFHER